MLLVRLDERSVEPPYSSLDEDNWNIRKGSAKALGEIRETSGSTERIKIMEREK